jgi:hypothetical protein
MDIAQFGELPEASERIPLRWLFEIKKATQVSGLFYDS